jgi:hypothetical protein
MIKLLSATIAVLSLTVILAIIVAYWLFIAYIEASAAPLVVVNRPTQTLSVEPTTGVPALNQDIRLQYAR